ncbi:hypothetical protein SDC9_76420 [bioreactor metagenome]|uniref:Uncharacterized protein n=1 Tax=bioreactor metagenome TaxID=1076179 RepID=A0A644YNJ3_9ZZZZ
MQESHFCCQRGLVTYCRRHSPKQGRDFGSGLYKPEDVVDKKENVVAFTRLIAERFGNTEPRQRYRCPGAGRLVHLPENQGGLRLFHFIIIHFAQVPVAFVHTFLECFTVTDYPRVDHFAQEVVPFTCAFPHTGKNGVSAVTLGNVVDQLHDQHGFANTSPAKKPYFPAFLVRLQQIDHFYSG